jgi:hypothetical protein
MSGRRKKPSADDATKAEKRRESNHVDEEVGAATEQDDQAEETFWWDFFERKDALENRLEEWKNDESADHATREERLAALQEQLDGMEGLARQDSVDAVPKELARLKRWYRRSTPEQRNPWARGLGPNVPFASYGLKRETLDTIQSAYDECTLRYGKAPQETVASVAGRARSTVQRYWKHLKK